MNGGWRLDFVDPIEDRCDFCGLDHDSLLVVSRDGVRKRVGADCVTKACDGWSPSKDELEADAIAAEKQKRKIVATFADVEARVILQRAQEIASYLPLPPGSSPEERQQLWVANLLKDATTAVPSDADAAAAITRRARYLIELALRRGTLTAPKS